MIIGNLAILGVVRYLGSFIVFGGSSRIESELIGMEYWLGLDFWDVFRLRGFRFRRSKLDLVRRVRNGELC